ncbi:MAG TPA: ergothioneine biosynthesis glutamate--cysteine ligase EgtA [Actinomycetota bacterium]|nr:ergothioneine biosynthesis glutamate--cysteine ligase EgtA [Actinomycetota bacterium]
MPSRLPILSVADVRQHVEERCFAPSPDLRVGIEVESLTFPADPASRVTADELELLRAEAGPLPGGGSITFEPGGQVEISSLPHRTIAGACDAVSADMSVIRDAASSHGIALRQLGADPLRSDHRVLDAPRYVSMESYFDHGGMAGRKMMCGTAAVHVNVGVGSSAASVGRRWRLAHLLGPLLAGAFANSPVVEGRPSGWRSSRLAAWMSIDGSRTAPACRGDDHAGDWWRYVLDAGLMLIRSEDRFVPLAPGFSFGRWMSDGHALGFPDRDDLEYHLSTLFPPVRPKGWLELRMIDSLPEPWWRVPAAVGAALLDDEEASEAAFAAAGPSAGMWADAARHGLRHPVLAESAKRCFLAAQAALARVGADRSTTDVVGEYFDRWVARGRVPADDLLESWTKTGSVLDLSPQEAAWT